MSADESAAHIFRKEPHTSGAHKNHERTKGLALTKFELTKGLPYLHDKIRSKQILDLNRSKSHLIAKCFKKILEFLNSSFLEFSTRSSRELKSRLDPVEKCSANFFRSSIFSISRKIPVDREFFENENSRLHH